jgi:hypothetical protein
MKFMRHKAGYSLLDHRRNEDVLKEYYIDQTEKKLAQYKQNWLDHVRMINIRHSKQLLD